MHGAHFFIANCQRLMTRAEMVQANLEKVSFVQHFIKNVEGKYNFRSIFVADTAL